MADSIHQTRSALARDDGEFGNIVVNSIKGVARLIECVDECIVGLSANIRVAKALSDFFHHQLFQDPDLKHLDLEWLRHDEANARRNATEAAELLMGVHDQTNNMLRRAQAMKRRGTRREDVVSLLNFIPTTFKANLTEAVITDPPHHSNSQPRILQGFPTCNPTHEQSHPRRLQNHESLFPSHADSSTHDCRLGPLCY